MGRKTGKTRRAIKQSPWEMIAVGVLSLLVAVAFLLQPRLYRSIDPAVAEEYGGGYSHYEIEKRGRRGRTEYLLLCCEDGAVYEVHASCVTSDLRERLDNLTRGERLTVRVNPRHGYVIEVVAEGGEVLNAEDAQRRMRNNGIEFGYLGIFMVGVAAILIPSGIAAWVRKRPRRIQKQKT